MVPIGQKLRIFRKRSKLPQQELELAIDASFGSISRIEAGKTNPTKETILKIAEVLNLNSVEIDYLVGKRAKVATQEECEGAIAQVRDYFKKPGTLAYLLDDRSRLIYASESFLNF